MANVLIVGDGPGGLSAALFLAKKGMNVTVFGTDETPMHKAMLYNYLGIPEITGEEFQRVAREQVQKFGAAIHDQEVTEVAKTAQGFSVSAAGQQHEGKYLILAAGPKKQFADALGLEPSDEGNIAADRNGRTSIERLYAIGWSTRKQKIQAIISAGDGACAALDIISAEAGSPTHDFDVVS